MNSNQTISGKAWRYGSNINTDLIIPGRYLTLIEPEELAKFAMADLDPMFAKNVKSGDIIVAGENFGCGSSREQAAMCLKAAGISAVVAVSFARIFYRNAINQGLLVLISPDAINIVESGDEVKLDLNTGQLLNLQNNSTAELEPIPKFLQNLVEAGGIIPYLKNKLHNQNTKNHYRD
jgi:3-isopropylmalate/(R)-2-methylmalate dehydratase small subunit